MIENESSNGVSSSSSGKFPTLLIAIILASSCGVMAILFCAKLAFRTALESHNLTESDKEAIKRELSKPVSDIEWEGLWETYINSTSISPEQRKEEWKNFIGKIVQWTGMLYSVTYAAIGSRKKFSIHVTLLSKNKDGNNGKVSVLLINSENEKAERLKECTKITFKGSLERYYSTESTAGITINTGEIVEGVYRKANEGLSTAFELHSQKVPLSESEVWEFNGKAYSIIESHLYLSNKFNHLEVQCEVPFAPDRSHNSVAFEIAKIAFEKRLHLAAEERGLKYAGKSVVLDKKLCIALSYTSDDGRYSRLKRYYFFYEELE
jgi:hypothetical protein